MSNTFPSLVSALVLSFFLAACRSNAEDTTNKNTNPPANPAVAEASTRDARFWAFMRDTAPLIQRAKSLVKDQPDAQMLQQRFASDPILKDLGIRTRVAIEKHKITVADLAWAKNHYTNFFARSDAGSGSLPTAEVRRWWAETDRPVDCAQQPESPACPGGGGGGGCKQRPGYADCQIGCGLSFAACFVLNAAGGNGLGVALCYAELARCQLGCEPMCE